MMKKISIFRSCVIALLCFLPSSLFSQYNSGGHPMSTLINLNSEIQTQVMAGFDVNALLMEDYENASKVGVPYRYGTVFNVNFNLQNSGTWTTLQDGSRIWRLAIKSQSAISINLFYNDFYMPVGGQFFVYNSDKSNINGMFNEINNSVDRKFATAPTLGETTVLEYYEPVYSKGKGVINVAEVVHAYRDIYGYMSTDELPCNININCPIGAPWVEQKRSVTRITFSQGGGGYLCTGSLVNNSLQDRKLMYLTAEHCAPDNHSSMVFYFNYESQTCIGTSGSLAQSLSGATLRSAGYATDFRLVEINGTLPGSYNAYFNGWDRSNTQPVNQTAIHHPGGANKKISIDIHPASTNNGFGGRLPGGFWQVFWDHGMTEGGSSGCPLYDQNKRVIGQNLGGTPSQCENPQAVSKVFGKFWASWDYGGSSGNQLKDWLDPNNSNITILDGIDAVTGSAPHANFTSNVTNLPIGGGTVDFFDLTTNQPTSWSWSFPGGTPPTSNVKNPTNISYTQTGAYTVTLTATNANGSNVKTLVNYVRVAGVPMSSFSLLSPPSNTTIDVSASDPTTTEFKWQKSAEGPTIKYLYSIRKLFTQVDYFYESDNGGLDTVVTFRKSFLDSLGNTMGYTGDSVRSTWRAVATNGVDTQYSSGSFLVTFRRSTIGITQISSTIPEKFNLYPNYPNPFNPQTIIKFDVAKPQHVKIRIYNTLGREVATLINQPFSAGTYTVDFDGSDLASGIYFYSLESNDFVQVKKMVLVK